jgi:hypothetical protein
MRRAEIHGSDVYLHGVWGDECVQRVPVAAKTVRGLEREKTVCGVVSCTR